jgi:hypothetical protein
MRGRAMVTSPASIELIAVTPMILKKIAPEAPLFRSCGVNEAWSSPCGIGKGGWSGTTGCLRRAGDGAESLDDFGTLRSSILDAGGVVCTCVCDISYWRVRPV